MTDFLSISLLQLLSVLSFVTSVFAVVRVGTGPLHRLSQHKFDWGITRSAVAMQDSAAATLKWSWNGLPVSFSLNTILGEDEEEGKESSATTHLGGYSGGAQLVRMNWQTSKHVPPITYSSQTPISMAKLIMSRHSQRKPYRIPRKFPGMPRSTPTSRLTESVV
ncbi:hypothetical protein K474DRAFT_1706778 [Panus rudis PR-1116 ss-1]|nr:hypothetical protein K474DRAFT_1706778 [Panus rudis PR-1116 ss-1]